MSTLSDHHRANLRLAVSNHRGSSLVQALITIGILSIVATSIIVTVSSAQKEQKNLSNKVEFVAAQSLIKDIMSRDSECSCQVNTKFFDSTSAGATTNGLTLFKASCAPGAPNILKTASTSGQANTTVSQMVVGNIESTSNSNEYTGDLLISSIATKNVRSLKPNPIHFLFHTDPTSPNNAKVITGCGPAPLTVPTGLTATVGPGTGTCTFKWTPSSGAMPITYTVCGGKTAPGSAASSCAVKQCTTTTDTCSISGLTVGSTYRFAVQATNTTQGVTTPLFSSEVSCTPVQEPGVMTINATVGDGKCFINWSAPTGTPTFKYTVFREDTNVAVTTSSPIACHDIPASPCTVSGLTNGSSYYFAANATNAAGPSPSLSNKVTCVPNILWDRTAYSKSACGGTTTLGLGSHHRCVLTGYSYDGDGAGVCNVQGTVDGAWSVTISDEGCKYPQVCSVDCTDYSNSYSTGSLTDGAPCTAKGLNGFKRGGCCGVGNYWSISGGGNYGCY